MTPTGLPETVRVGLFLAAFFAAQAVLNAFLPLWLNARGLDAAAIGQALGLSSFTRMLAGPGWGWAADRAGRQRTMLFSASAASAALTATLGTAHAAPALLALVVLIGIAAVPLGPLTDMLTLALAAERRLDYGRTRAWGSISFMLATAGAGVALGRFGIALVPWLLAAAYGAASMLAPALPPAAIPARHTASPAIPGAPFRWALLATALIQGSHAAYYAFAALRWHAAGIADSTIGLLIAEGVVAEIALFLWGRPLVERLGPARLTAFAAACCILRWTLTATVTAWPPLAAIQLLHAGTFACQHLSSMQVLRTLPPGRAGLAQTLLAALGFSAPTGALTWLAGRLYETGSFLPFVLMAAVGGSALLVVPRLPGVARPP